MTKEKHFKSIYYRYRFSPQHKSILISNHFFCTLLYIAKKEKKNNFKKDTTIETSVTKFQRNMMQGKGS